MPTWTFAPTNRSVAAETADIAFNTGLDFVDLPLTANSSTTVTYEGVLSLVSPNANFKFTLSGQGLSTLDGKVLGGTINQITLQIAGQSHVTITGLTLSGETFGNLARPDFNSTVLLEQFLLGGNDRISGTRLDDDINGMAGADRISGGAGRDDISAGSGNDTLLGGTGVDDLAGGSGADRFVFDKYVYGAGIDYISDFSRVDTLVLDNDAFRGIGGPGRLAASMFKNIDTGTPDGNDRFYYSQQSGALWYDPDGSGVKAWVLFANLQDGARLTAGDFQIIG